MIITATNKQRYTVSVDNELFQQLEYFRFEHRFQTRPEATVELIRLGFESLMKKLVQMKSKEGKTKNETIPYRSDLIRYNPICGI